MNQTGKSTKKTLLVIAASFFVLYIGAMGFYNLPGVKADRLAKQAHQLEREKIMADPLSVASVLNQENTLRNQAGASPMSMNTELSNSARLKCQDMADRGYYDHARPGDGKKGSDWIKENTKNWKWANENLNKGNFEANFQIVDSWMNSPAHKAALLDVKWTDTGIAMCDAKDGQKMVVQHFAVYFSAEELRAAQPAQTVYAAPQRLQTYCTSMNASPYTNTVTTYCR